ncbi:MAG: radical SAM protein [Deltaproteobacteria bacterium]|nr:radical SAM protein [Deltaproteobacteria bacterium]MBT4268524.1 radical SAM protein [Deltaproteobacteria bacterium]MBT4641868.1 radical SAM protein [Deltaproteobacteria bacterium]MBT6503366.1 radical SAM protein [Deltaproteobacteria bacterium]MBT7155624.1 radical SAM protein [Deltaproteobacteria bacterium]
MEDKQQCHFETGIYRPPSEGGSYSLLLRITRNCPWNRCTFCMMYKEEKFSLRSPEELKQEIDSIASVCDQLLETSHQLGFNGQINRQVALDLLEKEPSLSILPGYVMVVNWLISGAKTAFLQDANSITMKSEKLVDVLQYLRAKFPTLERVTSYARSKTIAKKEPDELKAIRTAGLERLHVGLETGDDELLLEIKKGVTSEEQIIAGKKAMAAGFQLSEYWMPGLGGKAKSRQHAENTARVLNEIDPNYIRSRPFFPAPGTPIQEDFAKGKFEMLSVGEQLTELKIMMEKLDFTAKVCFDHDGNHWTDENGQRIFSLDYEGYQFPDRKPTVLALIEKGLAGFN